MRSTIGSTHVQKPMSTYIVTKIKGKANSLKHLNSLAKAGHQSIGNIAVDITDSNVKNTDLHYKDTLSNVPIILGEDDKDVLESYLLLLKSEGYDNIKTFSDSRKALLHVVNPKFVH